MGWSCSAKAGIRLRAIENWIGRHGGCAETNTWQDPKAGNKYFMEIGRQNRDGAITGTIYRFINDRQVVRSGSLRIEPDGKKMRGPALLRSVKAYELFINGVSHYDWDNPEVSENALFEYLCEQHRSYLPGGLNEHWSKNGKIPYTDKAKIVCVNDGSVAVEWVAPMFFVWPE